MTNQRPITTPCSICGEHIAEEDFDESVSNFSVHTLLDCKTYKMDSIEYQVHRHCRIKFESHGGSSGHS